MYITISVLQAYRLFFIHRHEQTYRHTHHLWLYLNKLRLNLKSQVYEGKKKKKNTKPKIFQ